MSEPMEKLSDVVGGVASVGVLGAIALVALSASTFRRAQLAALVVERWSASPSPGESDIYVMVVGRFQGFWAWLRAMFGSKGDGRLIVDSRAVTLVDASGTHVIPLTSVSSLHHGYVRPLVPAIMVGLVIAFFVAVFGVAGSKDPGGVLLGAMVLGALAAVGYYLLNRTLVISVTEMAGGHWGFAFKGPRLDPRGAADVVAIIRQLVDVRRYG